MDVRGPVIHSHSEKQSLPSQLVTRVRERVTFSSVGSHVAAERSSIRVLVPAVLQLVSVKPGSLEIRPVCGGRFPTPSCLQSDHQTDAQTPAAAVARSRDDCDINVDLVGSGLVFQRENLV